MIYPLPLHMDGRKATISDGFHSSKDVADGKAKRQHRGADFMYRRRLPVLFPAKAHPWGSRWYEIPQNYQVPALACENGIVLVAEKIKTGWWVALALGMEVSPAAAGGKALAYHHLDSICVHAGDAVRAGQPLGIVGGSPVGYGLKHLHFDLAVNCRFDLNRIKTLGRLDGLHIDPSAYVKAFRHLTLDQAWQAQGRVPGLV